MAQTEVAEMKSRPFQKQSHAAELVFNLPKSITAIALDCGFSGSSTFERAFNEAFGVSSTEWRNHKICHTNRNMGEAAVVQHPISQQAI